MRDTWGLRSEQAVPGRPGPAGQGRPVRRIRGRTGRHLAAGTRNACPRDVRDASRAGGIPRSRREERDGMQACRRRGTRKGDAKGDVKAAGGIRPRGDRRRWRRARGRRGVAA
ncbi:hypothetical protein EASAB2608_07744 [Streptomyces sp. EAS-AB2608]|nr:hypothetical protein EASAB2608_07744 [Streptomyces sp. EAS-AB2608]